MRELALWEATRECRSVGHPNTFLRDGARDRDADSATELARCVENWGDWKHTWEDDVVVRYTYSHY